MNKTFIITGPPGAGKSSISNCLALQFELGLHINCDFIYNMVKGGAKLPWEDTDGFFRSTMLEAVADVHNTYVEKGFTCVIDYPFHIEELLFFLEEIDTAISLAVLLPDYKTNIERNVNRQGSLAEKRIKYFHDYYSSLIPVLSDFILDSTQLSIQDTADIVMTSNSYSSEALRGCLLER